MAFFKGKFAIVAPRAGSPRANFPVYCRELPVDLRRELPEKWLQHGGFLQ
jgi:hypothetical protein